MALSLGYAGDFPTIHHYRIVGTVNSAEAIVLQRLFVYRVAFRYSAITILSHLVIAQLCYTAPERRASEAVFFASGKKEHFYYFFCRQPFSRETDRLVRKLVKEIDYVAPVCFSLTDKLVTQTVKSICVMLVFSFIFSFPLTWEPPKPRFASEQRKSRHPRLRKLIDSIDKCLLVIR